MPYSSPNPSIGEINQKLALAKLPTLDVETAKKLIAAAGNDKRRVVEAVIRAADQNHTNSRLWLVNLMRQIGLNPDAPHAAPAPVAQPKPPAPAPVSRTSAPSPAPAAAAAPSPRPQQGAAAESPPHEEPHDDREEGRGGTSGAPAAERHGKSVHVYAGKGALCFEADTNRSNAHTVCIDAALALREREYNWGNKVRLQLTDRELVQLAALFCGYVRHVSFEQRGQTGKGLTAERQQEGNGNKKVFMRVRGPEGLVAIPVDGVDMSRVRALLLKQLAFEEMRGDPKLDFKGALALVELNVKALGSDMKALHTPAPQRQAAAGG